MPLTRKIKERIVTELRKTYGAELLEVFLTDAFGAPKEYKVMVSLFGERNQDELDIKERKFDEYLRRLETKHGRGIFLVPLFANADDRFSLSCWPGETVFFHAAGDRPA